LALPAPKEDGQGEKLETPTPAAAEGNADEAPGDEAGKPSAADMDAELFEKLKEKKKKNPTMKRPAAADSGSKKAAGGAKKPTPAKAKVTTMAKPSKQKATNKKQDALKGYKVVKDFDGCTTANAFASRHYNRAGQFVKKAGASAQQILQAKRAAYQEATRVWHTSHA
jgi:hypothetical protein